MKKQQGSVSKYSYYEIKAEIIDILNRQKFDRNKNDLPQKSNDLRALLCGFAQKVWGLGQKHNFSVVQGVYDDQQSLGCQNSLLQAINMCKDQNITNSTQKDKQIQQLMKQIKKSREIKQLLQNQIDQLHMKINQLCTNYSQAKTLFQQEIKYMKTQTMTFSQAENSCKQNDEFHLSYKLHLAQNYIKKIQAELVNQNSLIEENLRKQKRAQQEIKCLKIQINGFQKMLKISEQNNSKKKLKIEELLHFIEANSINQ